MNPRDEEDVLDLIEDAGSDVEIEVEVGDETFSQGEADAGKPIADPDTQDEPIDEDELAKYDAGVQKRIKSAHAKAHAERRAKEQALKERDEALAIARKHREEALRQRDQSTQYMRVATTATRASLEADVRSLTQELRDALESGDTDKQISAQTKLNMVVAQLNQIPTQEALDRDIEVARRQAPPEIAEPVPDTVRTWISENPWFDGDSYLRQEAVAAEELIVERYGMQPGAPDTLARVTAIIKEMFPQRVEKFMKSPPPAAAPVKAAQRPSTMPVVRSAPGGKMRVKLTPAQVSLAEELGISVEEYAREYARLGAS